MISRAGNLARALPPGVTRICRLYLWQMDTFRRHQVKKLTDKQKSRLWELQRNRNFQASRRLEGVEMPLVTLTAAEALARLEELRSHYER